MYFQFIDQFTQLGASDPRKLPPFPRMQLNQAIKKYGWLPETIHVTLRPNPMFSEQVQLKSRHTFITALSAEDRQKISETKTRWMAAEKVSLGEFRGFQQTQAVEQDK